MKVAHTVWTPEAGWSELPGLDSPATLVVVFGDRSVEDDPGPLRELRAAFPTSVVVGCSSAGHIAGDRLVDGACVAAVAQFEHVRVRAAETLVGNGAGSTDAGAVLARQLADDDLRAVFVLSDGLGVNGSELVTGLKSGLDPAVTVTGGLAGDGAHFERTWVLHGDERRSGAVVAVGLYGDALRVAAGSAGGWGIFGPERTITRSEGNVLHELDGKPALELYSRYLGDLAEELPASALLFPLSIRPPEGGRELVRTILAVDPETQTMTFAGDVPEGWTAQLMRSSVDRLVDGAATAGTAAALASRTDGWGDTLSIAVSCVGRRLVLGERTEEEIEATLDSLVAGTELVGFYSYGEIAPARDCHTDLHNQTMTVTTFGEVGIP